MVSLVERFHCIHEVMESSHIRNLYTIHNNYTSQHCVHACTLCMQAVDPCSAVLCLQANVLEGKYWKRRQDAVAKEYRKWRVYYHQKIVSAVCCVVSPSLPP